MIEHQPRWSREDPNSRFSSRAIGIHPTSLNATSYNAGYGGGYGHATAMPWPSYCDAMFGQFNATATREATSRSKQGTKKGTKKGVKEGAKKGAKRPRSGGGVFF